MARGRGRLFRWAAQPDGGDQHFGIRVQTQPALRCRQTEWFAGAPETARAASFGGEQDILDARSTGLDVFELSQLVVVVLATDQPASRRRSIFFSRRSCDSWRRWRGPPREGVQPLEERAKTGRRPIRSSPWAPGGVRFVNSASLCTAGCSRAMQRQGWVILWLGAQHSNSANSASCLRGIGWPSKRWWLRRLQISRSISIPSAWATTGQSKDRALAGFDTRAVATYGATGTVGFACRAGVTAMQQQIMMRFHQVLFRCAA